MKNIILCFIALLSTVMPVQADTAIRRTVGNIIKTQHGSVGFSASALKAIFNYQKGHSYINAGQVHLLSGHRGALLKGNITYAALHTEYRLHNFCLTGFKAGILNTDIDYLRFSVNGISIQENGQHSRVLHAGGSIGILPAKIRYTVDWYSGKSPFALHDWGAFIARPVLDCSAMVQKLSITKWYTCTASYVTLTGNAYNKNGNKIASGKGRIIKIKNTLNIPTSTDTAIAVSAAYLYFSADFNIYLTARNQNYFLFPYRFYHRSFVFTGSVLGVGGSYQYKKNRLNLRSAVFWYAVLASHGRDILHAKEKKSVFFKGREIHHNTPLYSLHNSHVLLSYVSLSYRCTNSIEVSANKHIIIPIIPNRYSATKTGSSLHSESAQTAANTTIIDPLLTGLSFGLTLHL